MEVAVAATEAKRWSKRCATQSLWAVNSFPLSLLCLDALLQQVACLSVGQTQASVPCLAVGGWPGSVWK